MDSVFLVISDTHGDSSALAAVLRWAAGAGSPSAPAFSGGIFLGDGAWDLSPVSAEAGFSLPWYAVRGNCDTDFSIHDSLVITSESGRKVFLAHGNHHGVYRGLDTIAATAGAVSAEAALFGHTHIPVAHVRDGILILNPGSLCRPRSRAGRSFAALTCPVQGPLSVTFWGLKETRHGWQIKPLKMNPAPEAPA